MVDSAGIRTDGHAVPAAHHERGMGLFVMTSGVRIAIAMALATTPALAASPAFARPVFAGPGLAVGLSPSAVDMNGGDTRSVTATLTNSGPPARVRVTATAPTGLNGDVGVASSDSSCSGSGSGSGSGVTCSLDIIGDVQKNIVFILTAKNPDSLGAGTNRTDTTGAVSVAVGPGSTTLSYAVTLHGPAQTRTQTQAPTGSSKVPTTPAAGAANTVSSDPGPSSDPRGSGDPGGSSDAGVSGSAAAAGNGTGTLPYRTAGHTGPLAWLLIGSGVLLSLAIVATVVALVVRRRRDSPADEHRADELIVGGHEPWPPGGDQAGVGVVLPALSAPVDPWGPGPSGYHPG
jgi:hypothetical protein